MFGKIAEQAGYTLVEAMTVTVVLVFIIAATYNLMDAGSLMNKQAEDGFRAQDQSRQVLSQLAKQLRPAENMNASGAPQVYADPKGRFIDLKVDTDNDSIPEIVRFTLNQTSETIDMYIDKKDADGKYNFEAAGQTYSQWAQGSPTWDQVKVMAERIVNAPPDGSWNNQGVNTDPGKDYRLFTFYGNNFALPLDSSSTVWMNYIKGVKIYVRSDIQPAEIPSPFALETNVNLRNIGG